MVKGFTYLAQVRDMKDNLWRVKKMELEIQIKEQMYTVYLVVLPEH